MINFNDYEHLQVTSILSLKTRRKYIHVALATASLLSTVLKNRMETTPEMNKLFFVHSHMDFSY